MTTTTSSGKAGTVDKTANSPSQQGLGSLTWATIVAGMFAQTGDSRAGAHAIDTVLNNPTGIAVQENGDLFIADANAHRVWRVDKNSTLLTAVAGNGAWGDPVNGVAATDTSLKAPWAIEFDGNKGLLIADKLGHKLYYLDLNAGTITADFIDQSKFSAPCGIAEKSPSVFYVADAGKHQILSVDLASKAVTLVAGSPTGKAGYTPHVTVATESAFREPCGIAVDSAGMIYVADTGNHVIRKINPAANTVATIAGSGAQGVDGDGSPAINATFDAPLSVAITPSQDLLVSDAGNNRIRRIDHNTGIITTVVGGGTRPTIANGEKLTDLRLSWPMHIRAGSEGNLYVVDTYNFVVRMTSLPE